MTSKMVTDISAIFAGTASSAKVGNATSDDSHDTFSKVMDSTSKTEQKPETLNQKTKQPLQSDKKNLVQKQNILDRSQENDSELEDAGKEIISEVMESLKTQFDVSDEDIQAAMETLGIGMQDLLNPESLQSLIGEINGVTDPMSLVTDETLYSQMKTVLDTLNTTVESVANDLEMTKEDFIQQLEKLQTESEPVPTQPSTDNTMADNGVTISDDGQDDKEPVIIVKDERPTQETTQETTPETETVDAKEEVPEVKTENKESGTEGQNFTGSGENGKTLFQNLVKEVETSSFQSTTSTEDIMKQIVEQIKITAKPETTSMELELNPASLGKVSVQIESKNGAVTAQFSAQNEAVKAAIEGQLVNLKDSLAEQGVKVEAVEVTIASHEFERNLSQGNENGEKNSEKTNGVVGGKRRRQINLLDENEEEELSEEDTIEKEMMVQNGNTVSYSV